MGQEEGVKVSCKPWSDENSIMARKAEQASFGGGLGVGARVVFSLLFIFLKNRKKKALGNKITSVQYGLLCAGLAPKARL